MNRHFSKEDIYETNKREKMLIITGHQRNANQTTLRYHLMPVRMAIIKKSGENRCWRGCGEIGTLLNSCWACKLVQPLWKTVWRFLKDLQIEIPFDSAIPLLGTTQRTINCSTIKTHAHVCLLQHHSQQKRLRTNPNVHQ